MNRIHHNGTGLGPMLLDQSLPLQAFLAGHRDGAQSRVSPVNIAMHPVNSNAIWRLDATADHSGMVGMVVSLFY